MCWPAPNIFLTAEPPRTHGFLRYLASQAHLQEIHFLWRPFLRDADGDLVLELLVEPNSWFRQINNSISDTGETSP